MIAKAHFLCFILDAHNLKNISYFCIHLTNMRRNMKSDYLEICPFHVFKNSINIFLVNSAYEH